MNGPTRNAPIAPAPAGPAFRIAMTLLAGFLLVQLAAVGIHYLPGLRDVIVERATASPKAEPQPTTAAAPEPTPAQAANPIEEGPDPALMEKITRLVEESDQAFRVGEHGPAMQKIQEADTLLPNDPGILLRMARILERKDEPSQAAAIYNRVLALPGLPRDLRTQTERKLSMMRLPETPATPTVQAAEEGADMRDETGLQPGATLGIVDTRIADTPGGQKVLRVSIKSLPDTRIDPSRVTLHVFFYERDASGATSLTESKVVPEWISPPVDWLDNEPELLNATYLAPDIPGTSYAGFVVGVYYKDELQDTRADPGNLAREHPLPLYLQTPAP